MADLTYQITADVQGAIAPIKQLQTQLKATQDSFSGLQKAIGALAVGAFIGQAYRMANALTDVSAASGIAVQNLLGFSQAMAANGGTTEGALASIGRFSKFINEAASGSKDAQSTLMELGISMQQLATLSEADLLRATVDGLARVQDNSRRTALSMDILGKSVAAVDFKGVNNDLDGFISRAGPSAAAVEAAGQAQQNFGNALQIVQVELLKALQPISELAVKMLSAGEAVSKFIDIAIKIGTVILLFTAVGKAVQILGTAFAVLRAAPTLVAAGWATLTKTFEVFIWQVGKIGRAGEITAATLGGLAKRFSFLQQGIAMVAKGFASLAAAAYIAWEAVKSFFDFDNTEGTNKALAAIEAEKQALIKRREEQDKELENRRQVKAALDEETAAIQKQVSAYQDSIARGLEKYRTDTDLISASEKQKLLIEELANAETAYLQAVKPLQDELAKKKESNNKVDLEMVPRIQSAIAGLTEEYNKQKVAIEANTLARAQANQEKAFEEFRTRALIDQNDELDKALNEIARGPMSAIEKKYYDISDAADASAQAAIRAEEARRGAKLDPQEAQKYYDVARAGVGKLYDAQRNLYEGSRTFASGWNRAFQQYKDDATNASKQAEMIFKNVTQGMEDLIVNFVKTGKFEWKSFVDSMLEDLLRSQLRQAFAGIMDMLGLGDMGQQGGARGQSPSAPLYVSAVGGGSLGAGGGGSAIGNIANSISRQFMGSSNDPYGYGQGRDPLGDLISGGGFGGGQTGGGGGFMDAISSAGSWLNDNVFGGFFANGGTLGAGKFGIAGENGPELISGPASITPLGGANVTYNINAVDAQSFKAMIAADPSFLFAVTEQGRRSAPMGRR